MKDNNANSKLSLLQVDKSDLTLPDLFIFQKIDRQYAQQVEFHKDYGIEANSKIILQLS
jgi:hypothetical protein